LDSLLLGREIVVRLDIFYSSSNLNAWINDIITPIFYCCRGALRFKNSGSGFGIRDMKSEKLKGQEFNVQG